MWKFIGGDKHIPGVPSRDLTDDEWEALSDSQRAIAKHDKVFEHAQRVEKPTKETKE